MSRYVNFLNRTRFSIELKATFIFTMIVLFAFVIPNSLTALSNELLTGTSGKVFCGVNYDNNKDYVRWNLRNFNENESGDITIERIAIFGGDGSTVFDSDTDGFPSSRRSLIDSDDKVLDEKQTAQYRGEDGAFPIPTDEQTPVQFIVEWSSTSPVLELVGSTIRIDTGAKSGRHQFNCRSVVIND